MSANTSRSDFFSERVRSEIGLGVDGPDQLDLGAFKAHGGKLVMLEHMSDYAQSPYAGIGYFREVKAHGRN